jgi:hypothetical protein
MADLMRLACLKATKTRLVMHVGMSSLHDLGKQNSIEFREQLQRVIADTQIVKAVPTPKEIGAEIGWAKLHPVIVDAFRNLQRSCPMNGCSGPSR